MVFKDYGEDTPYARGIFAWPKGKSKGCSTGTQGGLSVQRGDWIMLWLGDPGAYCLRWNPTLSL